MRLPARIGGSSASILRYRVEHPIVRASFRTSTNTTRSPRKALGTRRSCRDPDARLPALKRNATESYVARSRRPLENLRRIAIHQHDNSIAVIRGRARSSVCLDQFDRSKAIARLPPQSASVAWHHSSPTGAAKNPYRVDRRKLLMLSQFR